MQPVLRGPRDEKPADRYVQELVDTVKDAVVTKLGFQPPEIRATHFVIRVMGGFNYFVRVHIGCGKYILVRIHKPSPGTVSLCWVKHYGARGVAVTEQLQYFDKNNNQINSSEMELQNYDI